MRYFLFFLSLTIADSIDFLSSSSEKDAEIVSCVVKVAKKFFTRGENVVIISDDENTDLAIKIQRLIEPEFAVTSMDNSNDIDFSDTKSCYIVVQITCGKNPYEYLKEMILNPRSKYVIITGNDSNDLEKAGAEFWKLGAWNIIFLKLDENFRPIILGYDILANYLNTSGIFVLDIWRNDDFHNGSDLFANKLVDMKGYPLKVSVANVFDIEPDLFLSRENGHLKIDGVGAMILKDFSKKLNFRMIVDEHDNFGYQLENGNWNGLIGHVIKGKSDLSFAGILPTVRVTKKLDYTNFYRWESLHFAMKSQSKIIVSWVSIFKPFSSEVRLCFIVVLVLIICFVGIMKKYRSNRRNEENIHVSDYLKVLLSQSVKYPKKTGLRLIFALWLIYSYLIATSYSSSLVRFLSRPVYQKEVETLKELQDSHLKIGGPPSVKVFLQDVTDPIAKYIHDGFIEMKFSEVEESMLTRNMVSIKIRSSGIIQNWKNRFNDSRQLHMLRDPVVTYPTFYYLKKGHPYREPLNDFLGSLHSSGFIMKWLSDVHSRVSGSVHKSQGPIKLTLQHFAILFMILIFGYVVSIITFLLEYYRR